MADRRTWPALLVRGPVVDEQLLSALLDDFSIAAIEDTAPIAVPTDPLWDPTFSPPPESAGHTFEWRVFFHSPAEREQAAKAIADRLPGLAVTSEDIVDQDWAARSQRELRAIRAGSFVVAPPWDRPSSAPSGTHVIVIEPSRGFGTGHHASTRLCLRAISELDLAGNRVVDLGTGSGVLAMAAALSGARSVQAVDVDSDAIEAARQSVALNTLPIDIELVVADFRTTPPRETFDLVLANLTGGMLQSAAAQIAALVGAAGLLVVSGFYEAECDAVRSAFESFTERATYTEDGWMSLVLQS